MQHQGRVAQPAEAVVPVARPADLLGQRRRRGGDDAARRRVRQRLEGDERARTTSSGYRAVVGRARRPTPVHHCSVRARLSADVVLVRHLLVAREPLQRQVDVLALADGEVRVVGLVLRALVRLGQHVAAQDDGVRAGHGQQRRAPVGVLRAPHPRGRRAVAEAHRPAHGHLDLAAHPLDPADEVGVAVARPASRRRRARRRSPSRTRSRARGCRRGSAGWSAAPRPRPGRAGRSASGRCPRRRAGPRSRRRSRSAAGTASRWTRRAPTSAMVWVSPMTAWSSMRRPGSEGRTP